MMQHMTTRVGLAAVCALVSVGVVAGCSSSDDGGGNGRVQSRAATPVVTSVSTSSTAEDGDGIPDDVVAGYVARLHELGVTGDDDSLAYQGRMVCRLLDQGRDVNYTAGMVGLRYSEDEGKLIFGGAVKRLCPRHIQKVSDAADANGG